ncbi:MAG: HAD family acid phosphatase [Legionella sp.]
MNLLKRVQLILLSFTVILFNYKSLAEPANLGLAFNQVKQYHDSGEYYRELQQAIMQAHKDIITLAEANQKLAKPQKLALVLDIDETSLTNYQKMIARKFMGDPKIWHKEIMAADAPAIKPMLELYNDALKHGIAVFFVTGRNTTERKATEQNLALAGYKGWSDIYFRPLDYHYGSIAQFKTQARANISKKGYTIIASIGDQLSDLTGGYARKLVKLPNPFYYIS